MTPASVDSTRRSAPVAALALLAASGCGAGVPGPPRTVEQVDLERYAGRWYEIASIPNRFQDQCAGNTTAEYTPRGDGRIGVVNRCLKANGEADEVRGLARVVEPRTNAKLEVSFVSLFGWHLFWGDYWILALDPDYRWSVVGHPERRYGWILSRTPSLPAETRSRLDDLLSERGYDPRRFVDTPQGPGPAPDRP